MGYDPSDIRDFIKNLNRGSTIPSMMGKIMSIVKDEDRSSSRELSELISYDPTLAEMVLRIANSAMFGHKGRITDIDQAVMFLGYRQIRSIAAGMTVLTMFDTDGSHKIKDLWVHSYKVAFLSNFITERIPPQPAGDIFLSSLLHDIGRLIFYEKDPKAFLDMILDPSLLESEKAAFGCTHEQSGQWYLQDTGLPEEIIIPIRFHHNPFDAPEYKESAMVISLADALSTRLSPGPMSDALWGPEHNEIINRFGLTEDDIINAGEALGGINREIQTFFG